MGWLNKLSKSLQEEEQESHYKSEPDKVKSDDPFGFVSNFITKFAGTKVNVSNATQLATVYACLRDKAESISQLPMILRHNGKVVRSGNERLKRIFTTRPNNFMSMIDFITYYVYCMETTGNFYFYVSRNRYGNVSEIVPFRFQHSVKAQYDTHGDVYYTYVTDEGRSVTTFDMRDVCHLKLISSDGLTGISPIRNNARTMGIKLAESDYIGSIMESGQLSKSVLETDHVFKDENAIARLKQEWAKFGGAKGSKSGIPVLENGLKLRGVGVSPADAQLLEYGQYTTVQICGIFRVPPERVGIERKQALKTLEEQNKDYLRTGLMPLIRKIELMLTELAPAGYEISIDEKQFTRGDFQAYSNALGGIFSKGAISMNEYRDALGWDEIEGGDIHAIDTNNLTFGQVTDIPRLMEERRQMALTAVAKTETTEDDEKSGEDDDE